MEYYKKYRIIQNVRLAEGVNHIINFFHKLPIIRKFTKDKYKWYGLKRFVFLLGPLFSLLGQFIKSFISLAMAMWISGALIKFTNIPWNFENGLFDGLYDLGMNSLAFLAIYLTGAILSNAVIDAKQVIRELNLKLRMNPKATGLSLAVFDPLRVAIARGFAFSIILGFKNGFLVSFILLFIRLIANSVNLNLYRKLGKNVGDNFLLIIAVFIISFFIFK